MNICTQSRKCFSLLPILLTPILLLLLNACGGTPSSSTNAASNPSQLTSTATSTTSPTPRLTPIVTSVNSPTPYLTQQYEFTAQDSGKTATYTITSRFSIILNAQKYPQADLKLSCSSTGVIGDITNVQYEAPPNYAVRYEAVKVGTCTIKNGAFMLTINVITLV